MTLVWRPKCGVEITEVKYGIFLFRFFFHLVVQRILKGRPWSFDKHLLILGVIKEGANPTTIPLFLVPFWIQMHNLPLGFMSQEVGQSIGNYIGTFLEYDEKNSSNLLRGEPTEVFFNYERLGSFCYSCGIMSHVDEFCDHFFAMPMDDGTR
ncbi:hypothetical protein glysoja_043227, partial [Glycine soja]